jgi:alpha-amylase
MEKVAFLFCIHNHQPVGNFSHVIENAYQKAYHPFINILKEYPFMKITIHYSGILWDFFRNNHPDFLKELKELVRKGQIEIMGGGYYEPIISIIPDDDKLGQIELLSKTIRSLVGMSPRGLWLAERVWEPHLPKFLVNAGIEYISVDDYHFKKAGLKEEDLNGYFLTEDEGFVIKVFPGSEKLRYIIPFHPPEETIEYLYQLRKKVDIGAAIFADDGEKFGVWPYTYHTVYEEGWLKHFFNLIQENLNWIEPMTMGTYASKYKPLGRIYLPCSSYMEMDEWSLPTEAMIAYGKVIERLKSNPDGNEIRRFIKGGFWRNFFSKYPESNDLHKRVIHLSEKIKDKIRKKAFSIVRSKKVIYYLYQAQCNDGYWHGVFGGLYLPHLRHALYENLIKAEILYDQLRYKRKDWVEVERLDLNGDGGEEFLLKNPKLILLFKSQGGSLLEMDFKPKAFNILNPLTRRREGYHQKVLEAKGKISDEKLKTIHEIFESKEENLDQYLIFDRYRRVSFIDHFFSEKTDLESFRRHHYDEIGDFIEKEYEVRIDMLYKKKRITFSRMGNIFLDQKKIPIYLIKSFMVPTSQSLIEASYQIINRGNGVEVICFFGIEFNINLLAGNSEDRYYEIEGQYITDRRLGSIGESKNISRFSLIDEYRGMRVFIWSDKNFNLWRFPVETVSLSESGFERIFQGSCLLLFWQMELKSESPFLVNLKLGIEEYNAGRI